MTSRELARRIRRHVVTMTASGQSSHVDSGLSMADIGMAAFSVFFMQSPSFLAHQRQLCEGVGQGRSNCEPLLGMTSIPSDNHIRDMLDFVEIGRGRWRSDRSRQGWRRDHDRRGERHDRGGAVR